MIAFLLGPIGRWVAGVAVGVAIIGGVYGKGYFDGRTAYKAKIEREISNAVRKGDQARERALRDFDSSDELPDDGFRRP